MVGRRQHKMLRSAAEVTRLKATTPCAACKLLRRKCTYECPFSLYFSPHDAHKFAAVHKVFGASNVSKMLMGVPEARRMDTANSLIFEATMRLRDPVYGCMGVITAFEQQVKSLQAELMAVREEILKYKLIESANNLMTVSSDNNLTYSYPSSSVNVVASLAPQPQPPIAAATSSPAHLIDPSLYQSINYQRH